MLTLACRSFLAFAIIVPAQLLGAQRTSPQGAQRLQSASQVARGADTNRPVSVVLRQPVTVHLRDVTLGTALNAIAREVDVELVYSRSLVPLSKIVTVDVTDVTLADAFATALRGTGFGVTVSPGGKIVLVMNPTTVDPAHEAAAVITGTVLDTKTNQPVRGATVSLDGTTRTVRANDDGTYRIPNVSPGSHTLIARALGFAPVSQTVKVPDTGAVTVNFSLSAVATSLDQVVITGTVVGEQRRAIGNAVATINAEDIMSKSSAPNLSSLIEGRAPGVSVAATTGRLGAGPSIQIRGRSSIGLNTSPLLYIDGVRVNNATATGPTGPGFGAASNAEVAGRLNDINPEDIESIEIIKGPAASTIYGTEAANGVIQIITKKGAAGKTQFNLQVQNGSIYFRDAEHRMPTNYMPDATGAIVPWNAVKSEAEHGTPLFKTGQARSYAGSLSGGRDALSYYVSSAYENDLGIEPNNSLRQFTSHANINVSPTSRLDFGTSLNFVDLSSHLGLDVNLSSMLGAEVGHINLFPASRGFFPGIPPEADQTLFDNASGVNRFTGSQTITHRPTSWFTQRLIAGLDYTGDDSRAIARFAPPDLAPFLAALGPQMPLGSIGQTLRHNSIISLDYSGSAKFDLTSALSSTSSIGGQLYRTELNSSFLGGIGFPGPGVETVSATAQPLASTQSETINTTIGAYAQQQFGWKDRLFLTAGLRVDNNSAFGADFKWVTYPKVSATWVMNEEPFWHESHVLNSLKLRAAYGESGQQPVAFSALRTYSPVQGPNGTNAVRPKSIGNPDLKPERGKEIELGFDGQLFHRLDLDFTYYTKRTEDLIVSQPVALSSGFPSNQFRNLGRVDNHGIEVQATLQALKLKNVQWEITGNVGTNKDVIKDLGGLSDRVVSFGQFNVVGGPIGGIYTRKVVSADRDPATGLATNVLCDGGAGNAPVACDAAPFVFIGTPTPKVTGSVANTFTLFKNLRLYALIDFKRGYRVYNQTDLSRCAGLVGIPLCRANYYPQEYSPLYLAETNAQAYMLGTVDQYYQDASFAKLREVSATYTLPERFLKGFSRASITLAGRDLHTWTGYRGVDPEVNNINAATSANTGDQAVTPPLSRFIATINLTF